MNFAVPSALPLLVKRHWGSRMQRSSLYLVIGALVALVVAFGLYIAYEQSQKPGLEIKVDNQGISINGNP